MSGQGQSGPWMTEVRARVERRLTRFLADKRENAAGLPVDARALIDGIADLTLRGGKRLRAGLVAAALRSVAPDAPLERGDDVGAAIELLQSYLLIHDDWMDGDATRRGGPAVHAAFAERLGDAHLGGAMGILAGDLANTFAWEMMVGAPYDPALLPRALQRFASIQREVLLGQAMDVVGAGSVEQMQLLKTASYTTTGPVELGALLGGASEHQLDQLAAFAGPLGIAFQLRDDLLGTFGDERALGKPVGNDLRRGKRTSLLRSATSRIDAEGRAVLDAVIGNPEASDAEIASARELLVRCGARRDVEGQLERRCAEARVALDGARVAEGGKAWLRELVTTMTDRSG